MVYGKPMTVREARKTAADRLTYKVGCRDMTGWQALDFSRQR